MTTPHVKDNWDDSSESEQEEEIDFDKNKNEYNDDDKYGDDDKYNDDEGEWDFYEGSTSCIYCGKSNEVRIIMIESKRVFCYNACLGNDDDDDDDYDDDYDYDDLDDYNRKLDRKLDRKLGLSVSCRK